MEPLFTLDFSVRDYECDMQGIVNNAVYQNYLEHTRHEFLHACELDFAELTRAGIIVVVMRAEIDYLKPLVSGDRFRVELRAERKTRLKVIFHQRVIRTRDSEVMVNARITTGIVARGGRGELPGGLAAMLDALPRVPKGSTAA